MKIAHDYLPSDLPIHIVHPGEFMASQKPMIIQTLLGSCVSACLYDKTNLVGGLNHFLLAAPRYPQEKALLESDAGRYGIHAMELLVNDLMKRGAQRNNLRAKVFGGAKVLGFSNEDDFFKIHEINQRFILEFLETEKIPLDAADLGGTKGRVIYFDTRSLEVTLRYIPNSRAVEVEKKEKAYWQKSLEKPVEPNIFLF